MNRATKTSVAVVMMILTAVSSVASVNPTTPSLPPPDRESTLAAPTVVAQKVGFSRAELAKYQTLSVQSQYLASQEAAGASDTTRVVAVVVSVVLVAALVAGLAKMGPGMPAGPS